MSIIDTVKEHPIPFAIGGVILVFLLMKAGGGNSGGVSSAGAAIGASLQSQSIASDANVKISSINADVVKANNAAYASVYSDAIGAAVASKQIGAASEAALWTQFLTSGDTRAQLQAQREVGIAQIDAGKVIALDATANQVRLLDRQIAGDAMMADKLIGANRYAMDMQAQQLPTLLQHERNMTELAGDMALKMRGLDSATSIALSQGQQLSQYNLAALQFDHAADMAARNQSTAIDLANIGASLTREQSQQRYELEKYELDIKRRNDNVNNTIKASESANKGVQSWFKMFGFSDARLKTDIEPTGEFTARGYALYRYRFIGSPEIHVGVMAQDVAARDPGAVMTHAGFLMVDYSKV